MKHSIGPWHIGQGNGEGLIFAARGRMRLGEGGTTLYSVCKMTTGCDREEDEANAALIAAAPELLEACISALETINFMTQYSGMTTAKQLEAAIAKAKGVRNEP